LDYLEEAESLHKEEKTPSSLNKLEVAQLTSASADVQVCFSPYKIYFVPDSRRQVLI